MMQIKVPRRRVRYEGGYAVIDVPGDGEEMLRALLMAMDSDNEVALVERGEGERWSPRSS